MRKADKKLVIAANHKQALHYAKSVMDWPRDDWQFVKSIDDLVGLYDIVLYDVRAPKYKPTDSEAERYQLLRQYIPIIQEAGRVIKINIFNLAS